MGAYLGAQPNSTYGKMCQGLARQAALDRLPVVLAELKEMELRCKPWLPSMRRTSLQDSRRQLKGVLATLRAAPCVSAAQIGAGGGGALG